MGKKSKEPFPIDEVMKRLKLATRQWPTPVVTIYSNEKASPFMILASTIISLRTQDRTTAEASMRLFALARTPEELARRKPGEIEKAIYPAGFYKTKAKTLIEMSKVILKEYGGVVPDTVEELVKLNGVGRKTANLTVTLGYGKPGICVDTHVHRITNRWGYLKTKTPDETETRLRAILPQQYWIPINDWLVAFGQNLCKPISPICSICPVGEFCARKDVGKSR